MKRLKGLASRVGGLALAARQRRHNNLRTPAAVLFDLRAVKELAILAHADAHLGQPLGVARDGDTRLGQAGIGLDEGISDLVLRGSWAAAGPARSPKVSAKTRPRSRSSARC